MELFQNPHLLEQPVGDPAIDLVGFSELFFEAF